MQDKVILSGNCELEKLYQQEGPIFIYLLSISAMLLIYNINDLSNIQMLVRISIPLIYKINIVYVFEVYHVALRVFNLETMTSLFYLASWASRWHCSYGVWFLLDQHRSCITMMFLFTHWICFLQTAPCGRGMLIIRHFVQPTLNLFRMDLKP